MVARADGDALSWRGRRHDDDGPGAVTGTSVPELFETVFTALHDGEQVAVGFPAPLWSHGSDSLDGPHVRAMSELVTEIGRWRPWTVVSTSLPRWRATTSVLVWETDLDDADAAVDAFFALVAAHADHGGEDRDADVVNLAATAAVRSELQADEAQLREPVLLVSGSAGG
ncbi:hypothetical protein [Jatrophihabitans fulvus]